MDSSNCSSTAATGLKGAARAVRTYGAVATKQGLGGRTCSVSKCALPESRQATLITHC